MYKLMKRISDIILALVILVIAIVPMMLVALGVFVFIERSVIFKQKRYGENSKEFTIYKFRSMKYGAKQVSNREIASVQKDYPMAYGKLKGNLMSVIEHYYLQRNPVAVVAVSHAVSKALRQHRILNNVIVNGAKAVDLLPKTSTHNPVKTLVVAKLIPRKQVAFILTVFAQHPELGELIIAGDGPLLASLQTKFDDFKNIKFLGLVKNMNDLYARVDYYVSASVAEGLPMAGIEAMAFNLPLLLSDIPEHRELSPVKSEYIKYFESGNIDDFVQKMLRLQCRDIKYCDTQMIFQNNFNIEQTAAKYKEFFE